MYNYSNNCMYTLVKLLIYLYVFMSYISMYTEYNYSYLSTILTRIQFLYEYNFYILTS